MQYHEVARRLELKLGLGEFPMVRRRLFARLQRICEQKGDGALMVVAAVVEEAMGPKIRDKGKYFCWVIKRRLEENGFPFEPSPAAAATAPPAPTPKAVVVGTAAKFGKTDDQAREHVLEQLVHERREVVLARLRERFENEGGAF